MKPPSATHGAAPKAASSRIGSIVTGAVLGGLGPTGAASTDAILAALVTIGSAAVWAGNLFGLWWVALPVGVLLGLLVRGARRALVAAAVAGALGWALPLAWLAGQEPIGRAADVVAGIMGLGTAGGAIIVLTVLLGALLCAASAWIVVALRGLLVAERAAPAPADGQPVTMSSAPPSRPVQASPAGSGKRRRRSGKRR